MDFIVIPFARFQEIYEAAAPGDSHGTITETVMALKKRFPCLTSTARFTPEFHPGRGAGDHANHGGRDDGHSGNWGGQSRRSHGRNHGHARQNRAERPRIGTRELNREDISKKDFIANMNKLSRQNYDTVLRLIRTTYNSNFLPNYMNILWSMMIRQPDFQDLHIQVIQHLLTITPPERKSFVQTYWSQRCQSYFQEKQWMPPDDFFAGSQGEYDEFCDYIKWKKTTGASLLAWLRLMEHAIIPPDFPMCFNAILDGIQAAFREHTHKFAECLLEWFVQMTTASTGVALSHLSPDLDFILNDWLQIIKERGLSSSLRFKIMDVRDLLYKK